MRTPFKLFSVRLWLLPMLIFVLATPLWLHVWEPAMFVWLNQLCLPVAAPVWTGLSLLGNGWGILGVTAPLLLLAPRLNWAWICAAPFAITFARLGKSVLVSPRPAAEVDNAQMRIVGEVLHNVSMPSGHTTTAFAVATAIFFALTPAQRKRHGWQQGTPPLRAMSRLRQLRPPRPDPARISAGRAGARNAGRSLGRSALGFQIGRAHV